MRRIRIGLDIGGTFTDLVLTDEDSAETRVIKVPSTRTDPGQCIRDALDQVLQMGYKSEELVFIAHGTTVATNALLESKGANSYLFLTKGFRAIPEVGDQTRDQRNLYDLYYKRPPMLIPQRRILEVRERINSKGQVVENIDTNELSKYCEELRAKGAESIAICLLFSFLNPEHEQIIEDFIRKNVPSVQYISRSSIVLPQIREYIRLSTVSVDAYVGPVLKKYLDSLKSNLDRVGIKTRPYIVHSGGGMMTVESAETKAVWCIESGPAAGIITASRIGRFAELENLFAFDMGGTTAKFGIVVKNEPLITTSFRHAGYPIGIPVLDMIEIGSGGGSIAWIDPTGIPRVGPESAGSEPGPSCYKRGGKLPTVTDADLLLGYINPDYFLGGKMILDSSLSRESVEKNIAKPLNLSTFDAALGIFTIVNVQMSETLRMASIERGHDPRDFTLVAFGGAGPIHACFIAEEAGIPNILVPLYPGVTTAFGLTSMDIKHEYMVSKSYQLSQLSFGECQPIFDKLKENALIEMRSEGLSDEEVNFNAFLDMRYAGQGYELRVPIEDNYKRNEWDSERLRKKFDQIHLKAFGMKAEKEPVDVVNFRLVAIAKVPEIKPKMWTRKGDLKSALKGYRKVRFGNLEAEIDCPFFDRMMLPSDVNLKGPAIIEQPDSTIVVPPNFEGRVDKFGNIMIKIGARS